MCQETEEITSEVTEGETDMTQGQRNITQTKVLEEITEEEKEEEIMDLREQEPMAIGTHEVSAKRFHAWGNL